MLTMRGATALLSAARTPEDLWEVLRSAGFAPATVALDEQMRADLGLAHCSSVGISAVQGHFRTLVVRLDTDRPMRESLDRISRRLASEAPHVLWLVAAVDRSGEQAAIIAWTRTERLHRVTSFIWEPARVVASDAETLCALAAIRESSDLQLHARCVEVLGRESLTRRFYRVLSDHVGGMVSEIPRPQAGDASHLALLCVSRLLFLRFLEAKGWLNGEREFIAAHFDECMARGGGFHRRVLLPLFFGTLNTPFARRAARARQFGAVPFLNGGLFTRTAAERRTPHEFSDERMGALLQEVFQRFRFVAREDSATWSEASVDPEMLGRAFESLMAGSERKSGGAFYTPHALVKRVADHALADIVASHDKRVAATARILDPACGSGAFLVHALERLADHRKELGEPGSVSSLRRDVLARSIFGVDRNPTAVWLCELRLWLSVVIESDESDPMRVTPLPNLDRNIRVGDALDGPGFVNGPRVTAPARVAHQRHRYVRATGRRKSVLARCLDRFERERALEHTERLIASANHARCELLLARRMPDLFGQRQPWSPESRRELSRLKGVVRHHRAERNRLRDGGALPFSFSAFFAEVHAAGGFDAVLGNPPWVRLHHIPEPARRRFRESYSVFRTAHWEAGARSARAAPGFASQIDLSALFVERSLSLLRTGGTVALLLPAKLWRSLSGGGVRQLLTSSAKLLHVEDVSESRHAFDAVVYPSLVVAKAASRQEGDVSMAVHDANGRREWPLPMNRVPFDATPGAPWVLLPPDIRHAFDALRDTGRPLAATDFGAPRLGVKTGCNAAFLVRRVSEARGIATVVDAAGEEGCIESELLRPILRGDGMTQWRRPDDEYRIVWTHDTSGSPLSALPRRAAAWLGRHHGALIDRADAKGSRRWWSLFRTEAGDSRRARVVWSDFGKRPRALVLEAGDGAVPLNTCYVVACADSTDAWALATLLNSRVAAAWLNAIAEPARGGYRRYLGWTVGQLPIPTGWTKSRASLARAGRAAARGSDVGIDAVVLRAFKLDPHAITALLEFEPCE